MDRTICTVNVRGIGNKQKRNEVFQWLKLKNFDICLLQETHLQACKNHIWEKEWGGQSFYSGTSSNANGVAILVNPNITTNNVSFNELCEGRLIALELSLNDTELVIINIYGPNNDDIKLFQKLEEYLLKNNDKNILIGGDFNTVLNPLLDKRNGNSNYHSKIRKILNDIINSCELNDVWRILNPEKKLFSWFSNTKPRVCSRIDYYLASNSLMNSISYCSYYPGHRTDHSAVLIKLNLNIPKRGPGYFKFNNSLLQDETFLKNIENCIQQTENDNKTCNPETFWDVLKGNIRNDTIKYASLKKSNTDKREKELIQNIKDIENLINVTNDDDSNEQHIKMKNEHINELDNINTIKLNGIITRAKAVHVE